jgi:hypothetical protein
MLLALLILSAMSWADIVEDLSIDLPLPSGTDEQVLLCEEDEDQVFLELALSAHASQFLAPVVPKAQALHAFGCLSFPPQADLQLYQRLSTYRI